MLRCAAWGKANLIRTDRAKKNFHRSQIRLWGPLRWRFHLNKDCFTKCNSKHFGPILCLIEPGSIGRYPYFVHRPLNNPSRRDTPPWNVWYWKKERKGETIAQLPVEDRTRDLLIRGLMLNHLSQPHSLLILNSINDVVGKSNFPVDSTVETLTSSFWNCSTFSYIFKPWVVLRKSCKDQFLFFISALTPRNTRSEGSLGFFIPPKPKVRNI